jgi:hypothetical protein
MPSVIDAPESLFQKNVTPARIASKVLTRNAFLVAGES